MEISATLDLIFRDEKKNLLDNLSVILTFNTGEEKLSSDDEGKILKEDLIPSDCKLKVLLDKEYKRNSTSLLNEEGNEVLGYRRNEDLEITIMTYQKYIVVCCINNDSWSN